MKTKQVVKSITHAEIAEYELLVAHLDSLIDTVEELSKKKQDEVMNVFKVTSINKVLKRIIELLGDDPSTSFVEALDETSLPTNSDALLILKQFKTALSKFHALRYYRTELGWDWNVKD
ncbi:MAG: hypothetical protein CVU49_03970 [Candidatus Cloacimonetes bacterium HGW-Cloacimonetes-2]|jgi:hypothetical protein|nr:MAG: hypothetical protein CVU49_03970 [Candidatus Cloacimonetes bacterium HGW-Cloacimonetes-2]